MNDLPLDALLIPAFLLGSLSLALLAVVSHAKIRDIERKYAWLRRRASGLHASLYPRDGLVGSWKGFSVLITQRQTDNPHGFGRRWVHTIELVCPRQLPHRFAVYPHGGRRPPGSVALGDPEFDARLMVVAEHPQAARQLLATPAIRAAVLHCNTVDPYFRIYGQVLSLTGRPGLPVESQLPGQLDLLADLAGAFMKVPGSAAFPARAASPEFRATSRADTDRWLAMFGYALLTLAPFVAVLVWVPKQWVYVTMAALTALMVVSVRGVPIPAEVRLTTQELLVRRLRQARVLVEPGRVGWGSWERRGQQIGSLLHFQSARGPIVIAVKDVGIKAPAHYQLPAADPLKPVLLSKEEFTRFFDLLSRTLHWGDGPV